MLLFLSSGARARGVGALVQPRRRVGERAGQARVHVPSNAKHALGMAREILVEHLLRPAILRKTLADLARGNQFLEL